MARILTPIQRQKYELIRDRIGEILADELIVQAIIEYDDNLNVDVFVERFIPFDKSEVPCINILLARGLYDNKSVVKSDGTYTYNIDHYVSCKSTEGSRGDSAAARQLQKLMGVSRAILEDPQYNTLGFTKPYISHTEVREMNIGDPVNNQDGINMIMGRLTFVVRAPETVLALEPRLLDGYDTTVKLYNTDKGYLFGVNTSSPPIASFETVPIPSSGVSPFTIAFIDTSLNYPDLWLWEVSGGTEGVDYVFVVGSATSQNPTMRFDVAGNFGVKLTVTNNFGSDISAITNVHVIGSSCDPAIVKNSDDSYHEEIDSGDELILPDDNYNIYVNGVLNQSFSAPSVKDLTINIS